MEQLDFNIVTWSKTKANDQTQNQLPKGYAKFKQLDSDDPHDKDSRSEMNPVNKLKIRQSIQKARLAKSLSQKDFAGKLRVNVKIVNEYESGKVVPDKLMLSKMSKVLGVKL